MFLISPKRFKNRKIRKTKKDYIADYVIQKRTFVTAAMVGAFILLTLSNGLITKAAPNGEPPTGNISPVFSSVTTDELIINTQENAQDQNYLQFQVQTVNSGQQQNPGFLAAFQKSSNERGSIAVSSQGAAVSAKNPNNGDESRLDLGVGGARLTSEAEVVIDAPVVKINSSTIAIGDQFSNLSEGSGFTYYKHFSLGSGSHQRNMDSAVGGIYRSCPILLDLGSTSGSPLINNGVAMACTYHATGNPLAISNSSRPANSPGNGEGTNGCIFDLSLGPLSQENISRYGATTRTYGKMACYYGTTPQGRVTENINIGL